MSTVVPISGNVHYAIVLDPSSWIFDHRKIELKDYLEEKVSVQDVLESNRENRAGAAVPRMVETGVKYEKDRWLTDSFVIPVLPFLNNSEPKSDARVVRLISVDETSVTLPLDRFKEGVFGFSIEGKVIKEDGPLYFYDLNDFKSNPIKRIAKIVVD